MENKLNEIEHYLTGKLDKQAQKEFEMRVEKDEHLAAEVATFKDIIGGIRLKRNKELKDRLNEIHEQVIKTPHKATIRPLAKRRFLVASIAAAVLLLLAVVFLLPKEKVTTTTLYANYFEAYAPDWNTRGSNSEVSLTQVITLYDAKQYENLLAFFDKNSTEEKLNSIDFIMIKGIASLETGHYEQAKQYFTSASQNPLFKDEAQWYMALTYLKNNNIKECKIILAALTEDSTSDFYEEALLLLKDLP